MTALYEQPLRKSLISLSTTINWMLAKGNIEVNTVPTEHIEAVKQLERIGIVHKRNNKIYELQKVRLKKLMDSVGMDTLPASVEPAPVAAAAVPASSVNAASVVSAPVAAVVPSATPVATATKPVSTATAPTNVESTIPAVADASSHTK